MLNSLTISHFLRLLFSTKDIKRTLAEIVRTFNLRLLIFILLRLYVSVYNHYTERTAQLSVLPYDKIINCLFDIMKK